MEWECLRPALPSYQENAGGDPQCHTAAHCRGKEQDTNTTGQYVSFVTHRATLSSPAQRSQRIATASALVLQTHIVLFTTCSAETFPAPPAPAAAAASGPSLSPPPLCSSSSSTSCFSPPSRRQDGQDTLQPASRDQQNQLFLCGPWELIDEEAGREDGLAQPRLRFPGRPSRSRRQPGSGAGKQHESAAAGAQEAAGRSAEQIHEPDPRLAEQVRTWMGLDGKRKGGWWGGAVRHDSLSLLGLRVVICPVHVALLPPRHGEGGLGGLNTDLSHRLAGLLMIYFSGTDKIYVTRQSCIKPRFF